jgi:DNA-binding NarL/FixJ family response regulator
VLLLDGLGYLEVCAAHSNCDQIVAQVEQLKPTVILMDIDMPGIGGIAGVRLAKKHFPEVFVLMFTVFDDDERLMACLRAGANGYLLKKTPPNQIIEAIDNVTSGGAPMTPEIAQKVLATFRVDYLHPKDLGLTNREIQVLELLIKGHSYKMIGGEFNISLDTVRTHLKHIYEKMHVNNGNEAVAKAMRMNFFK